MYKYCIEKATKHETFSVASLAVKVVLVVGNKKERREKEDEKCISRASAWPN